MPGRAQQSTGGVGLECFSAPGDLASYSVLDRHRRRVACGAKD